jgi:hypothetical protein
MVFKVGDLQYFHTNFDKFERTMFPAGHAHIQFFNAYYLSYIQRDTSFYRFIKEIIQLIVKNRFLQYNNIGVMKTPETYC